MPDALPGSTTDADFTPAEFDAGFAQMAATHISWRLSAEAYGQEYPSEVQPYGMTTTWTLGRFVSELRLDRDRVLRSPR